MKPNRLLLALFLFVVSQSLCAQATPFNRGVNLSNWFQAGSAQEIQFNRYTQRDFEQIRNLGADVVRLPINLHYMTSGAPDYTLDPLFLEFLDQVVDWSEALGMHLILDNHTFDPSESTDPNVGVVLEKVWLQMAQHYKDRSGLIYYEIMNEPHGISDEDWNAIQQDVVAAIRTVDDQHTLIVGGAGWNSFHNLSEMPVYEDDNLIYTFHFYDPFLFSHQGASWVDPSMVPLAAVPFPYRAEDMPPMPPSFEGSWLANAYDRYPDEGTVANVRELLDIAIQFRAERNVPIFLGELGVLMNNSDPDDRVHWHRVVREYLDENAVSWTLWDYHGGFGVFERGSAGQFDHDLNLPLLEALGFNLPPQTAPVVNPDSVGFKVYSDQIEDSISNASNTSGTLDFYSADRPWGGKRSIYWTDASRYNQIGFNFQPDRDLAFLQSQDYALDFMVRGDSPGVRLNIRFLDSDNGEEGDRRWRMGVHIDDQDVDWDNSWQRVHIPFSEFEEQGAWDDGNWYPAQGDFNWAAVDRLEIVTDDTDLHGVKLWFDNIQLTRLAPQPPSMENEEAVNGLFFDPQTPGHGFDFNVHETGMTVFYYGHTSTGERLWLISDVFAGAIEFDQPMVLTMYEITEGEFAAPVPPTSLWGEITLTLSDCDTGTALFDGLDGILEMSLVRLAGLPYDGCIE